MTFSNLLIHWYLQNKRDLPWRNTQNPYKIWLSEIILQQTRVAQGMPFYNNFITAFPTVYDLADADEQQVLKLWQGLGYYSRARNLHKTSKIVVENYQGNFPTTFEELIKLKGIGEYTAAAIASFSVNEVVPVVDGNVFRVLARYFGVETDISSHGAKKEFTNLAKELIDVKNPAAFNQAIMEFGALQCVPKNPNCDLCIFNNSCVALQYNKVAQLPVKLKKTKVSERFLNYIVFKDEANRSCIQKRTAKGIWQNLYEFPLIETKEDADENVIIKKVSEDQIVLNPILSVSKMNTDTVTHKLSHQHLRINFWEVKVSGLLKKGETFEKIKNYPFPIVIFNFIEKHC